MAIWIQSLSWALIYSLAQGIAVYASLWLVLKIIPATSANVRYHLSLSGLTVLLVWFVATWSQQYHSLSLADEQVPAINATVLWLPLQHVSIADSFSNWNTLLSSLQVFFPWMSAFYIVGFGLMLARLSAGMLQLFSLRNRGVIEPEAALEVQLLQLKKRIHLDVPVKLLVSIKAQVPMVIGFFKPVILLPVAAVTQLDPVQLETILLHELAHIKRHDYLVNILQTIVETILFFNPFVWMISTITRREREHCCDDLVVDNTSEPISYATALAALASRRASVPLMVVAATGQSTHLFNRIQRIMEMKKNTFSYSRMVATIIIIGTITASIAWVKPTFPKAKKSKPVATATTEKTTTTQTPAETKDEPVTAMPEKDAVPYKDRDKHPTVTFNPNPANVQVTSLTVSEETVLVGRLLEDKLVDQVKGFVVEKRQDGLYINGLLHNDAGKYLNGLKKETMRVQVFSMEQRMRMHPDASFIQILLPATFSSGCIDTRPKKEGC